MPTWLTWLLGFILKGFGIGQPEDPVKQATAVGEKLGKAESERDNATAAVHEVERAQQGSSDATAARDADPDKLLRDGPDVRPYRAGGHD